MSSAVDMQDWKLLPPRVEGTVRKVLDIFAEADVKGTFFILGWVAYRYPHLVRRIAEQGHEIACHSYAHRLVYDLNPQEFKADTARASQAIFDACGIWPTAYRAPSYTITGRSMWALEVLAELGFTHDSSIYPINHDRYGILGYSRYPQIVNTPSGPILEVPVATVQISKSRVAPIAGGAYLRLLPYRYVAAGLRTLNREGHAGCLYFHPWELDPDLPMMNIGLLSRLRTYGGLFTMTGKVTRLVHEFRFSTLSKVYEAESAPVAQYKAAAASANGVIGDMHPCYIEGALPTTQTASS
jgi:polysaccharide deacetylase family protein (PEP-CTERM system associated)